MTIPAQDKEFVAGYRTQSAGRCAKWAETLLAYSLAILMIAAGLPKILNPGNFAFQVYQYQILPGILVNLVAIFLPALEIITGMALPWRNWRRTAFLLTALMLLAFTIAIAFNLARGLDITCGCFSTTAEGSRIGTRKLLENLLLLAGAITGCVLAARREKSA